MPYRLISFLTAYKVLLAGLSMGVCFWIGVVAGVAGRAWSMRVLVVVAAVRKVGI